MRLGVHIRIDKGLLSGLQSAQALGCETIQLFSSNPNSWARRPLDPENASAFAEKARVLEICPIILHTPYLCNLASPDDKIWTKSRDALMDAVMRAGMLGADRVVTHIGSHKGAGANFGFERVAAAVDEVISQGTDVMIVLELGAGSGDAVGSSFEEVAEIIDRMKHDRLVGIAIDTAHLYAAGYDVSNESGVNSVFEQIERLIGLERLKVIHLNDTRVTLGSRRDRHYHIGLGNIGVEGFKAILAHPATKELPGIIETPAEGFEWDLLNLGVLKQLRVDLEAKLISTQPG